MPSELCNVIMGRYFKARRDYRERLDNPTLHTDFHAKKPFEASGQRMTYRSHRDFRARQNVQARETRFIGVAFLLLSAMLNFGLY